MPFSFSNHIVMTPSFQLSALAYACLATLSFSNASAQTTPPGGLTEIVITGNPLGRDGITVPVNTLGRVGLLERGQSTLGETLSGLPGVSSTYFGPNASRPIIRGLDGDRIRVLNNSASSLDASALSYDHAVPLDVLSTDRIEVLRGPAALLYGGSAVGGVVNVIDNRIPQEAVSGVLGKAQLQAGTGNDERSLAGVVEAGNGRLALHLDGFERRTGDVRVPVSLACEKPGSPANARRICNSASNSKGGALGASTFWDRGFFGASVNSHQSDYGTVAEDEVTIGMKTTRFVLEGQVRPWSGWLESVKARWSHTHYQHTEFFQGGPETVFSNKGQDLRIEARHRSLAGWQGVVGVQTESSRFSAVGDEAFAPFSRTRSQAVFVHEERPTAWGQVTAGARWETVRVASLGNLDLARFDEGIGAKKFSPLSVAAGAVFKLSPTWSLTGHAALTQRAPKDYELFANGPHLATQAWEIGNKDLGLERSKSLDAGLAWKSGADSVSLTVFASHFANFIGLMNNSAIEEDLAVQLYQGVKAQFRGLEASGRQRLWQGTSTLDLDWRADSVRATNSSTGEPLPRIAPMRLGATLVHGQGPWSAKLGADWHAAQKRVPEGSVATGSYTLVNASVSYRQKWDAAVLNWFARLDNLTDQLAYSASSILTSTAFGKSPLPGRSFKIGVQASF
jgi:iron complex outermembrane receptor protein